MGCTENKLIISQIWLCGFELATDYHCHRTSNHLTDIIFEKCAKIVCIAKLMKSYFFTVDCASNHINEWHQVPRRKNLDFIFVSQKFKLKEGEECMYINYDP